MLELRSPTPPAWANRVLEDPVALLADHAQCELGAASAAQALVHRHPGQARLVDRMAALAIEELVHFRRVVALLESLGGELGEFTESPYVTGLHRAARARAPRRGERERLLDRLLVGGLVEARSCERFELLARAAGEPEIAALYGELGPSERGHAELFPRLAAELFGAERAAERAAELADAEAELIAGLPFAPRMHSGPPSAD